MINVESLTTDASDMILTNLQEFCEKEDIEELTPELSSKMIERTKCLMLTIGQMILVNFFESYDIKDVAIEENGEVYRRKYNQPTNFVTRIGKIRVSRNVYQKDRGGKSIAPLDRKWNMEHEYMSPEVQQVILYLCANNPPAEVEKTLEKIGLFHISASAIKDLVKSTGELVEENKAELMDRIYAKEQIIDKPNVMVSSLDGVNVLLNEKGKKKGRPKERPDNQKSTSAKSAYKNAICGSISFYDIDKQEDTDSKKARRLMTKYVCRMPEDRYPTFKHEFEKEISHCSKAEPMIKIAITDGHKSIEGYIKDNPFYKDHLWLLDFYHAAEHLSKLAESIFGKSNKKGKKWYSDKRDILKHTEKGVSKVIRSAQYYMEKHIKTQCKRKEALKELNYFRRKKHLMNYKLHIDNGWPIGSGVIEGACKSLVKQRMCRSGQRWSRKGGQNILNLRTIVKSGRWGSFWEEYMAMKYSRKCA